jgi:hypothetical protein
MSNPSLTADEKEWRKEVSFDFGEGGMQPPEGFKDLSIGDEVTVVVTGKVKNLSQSKETSNVRLQMEQIQLKTGHKPRSMAEIMEGKKKNKKM